MEKPKSARPTLIHPSVKGNELKMLAFASNPKATNPKMANENETSHDKKTAMLVASPQALRVGCFIV